MNTENKESLNPAESGNNIKTDVTCCDFFSDNIKNFGWFKLDHLDEEKYLMPHILGTDVRLNFCPSCGSNCRNVMLTADFYHSR